MQVGLYIQKNNQIVALIQLTNKIAQGNNKIIYLIPEK